MIKLTFTHWLSLKTWHLWYRGGCNQSISLSLSLSHTEHRSILTPTINTLPAAILLNALLLTPIVMAATAFTIAALSCEAYGFWPSIRNIILPSNTVLRRTMRSHHKPVFEVEREVYWDFKSNSAEGQKVFESQKLEFPKVLSVTITLIITIMIKLITTCVQTCVSNIFLFTS
jgi:hypothetical protein